MSIPVFGAIGRPSSIIALALLACGGPQAGPRPEAVEPCHVLGEGPGEGRKLTFALSDPVEAEHAPAPRTPAEARVFPLLYSSLVHFDCEGHPRPGLAAEWESEDDGRSWILRLDSQRRFWDGSPVTAGDVAISLLAAGPFDGTLTAGIAQVGVRDERTLSIRFERRHPVVPLMLGAPELAVAVRRDEAWPLGAGAYRPQEPGSPGRVAAGEARIEAVPSDGNGPALSFQVTPGADGRDLIDQGADLLVARDAAVLEYVRLRPELTTAPLPWDRTYVLLAPTRVRAVSLAGSWVEKLPGELLERLARDAVTGSARPHRGPAWWESEESCRETRARLSEHPPPPPTAAYRTSGVRRVVYREGDETAGELAGRIVALGGRVGDIRPFGDELAAAVPGLGERPRRLNAVALSDSAFDSNLMEGGAFLFVLPLPLTVYDPCRALEELGSRAPWLALGTLAPGALILPLIATRPYLVARKGVPSIHLDWGGTLRLEPSSPKREAAR